MEKNTVVALFCLLVLPLCLAAQGKKKSFLERDIFCFGAGVGGGILVYHPTQNIYLTGNIEYFMERRISVKADGFLFLPDYHFEGQLQKNNSVLLGAAYHFPYLRWDTWMSFQPGISFPGLSSGNTSVPVKTGVEPVLALSGGLSYYIGHNFHASASVGYLHGTYYPESTESFGLDEVRFSAGFGFNVFFNRYAPYERRRVHF